MAASVQNLILTFEDINIVKDALRAAMSNTNDNNTYNMIDALVKKLDHQQGQTYPAMEYPFWRKMCTTEKELMKLVLENKKANI